MFLKTKCTHGDWNRRINATTNSAKKEVRIFWTCWVGKRNDAGTWRWKEEERKTKEKMDG